MMRSKAVRLIAGVLVTAPLLAVAAESGERPGFGDADANGDRAVSLEEARAAGVPESEAKR